MLALSVLATAAPEYVFSTLKITCTDPDTTEKEPWSTVKPTWASIWVM